MDTRTFLWWMQDAPELPAGIRRILGKQTAEVAFSVLSAWEIVIKAGTGKLSSVPLDSLEESIQMQGFPVLPCDRGLIAAAMYHDLVVLTRDRMFGGYAVKVLWE
ncbi:MAG: type II toxin-antitoxin system VapC family toxin [Spirochaetota bacterium]